MIVVTGAAGFIGSAIVWELNRCGIEDIIVADKLRTEDKWRNLAKRTTTNSASQTRAAW